MKIITSIWIILISTTAFNQDRLSGIIVDSKSNKSIPYVNIGVIGKDIGTVSNISGEFIINVKSSFDSDTIKISSVGYELFEMRVVEFKKNFLLDSIIKLTPKMIKLDEFEVASSVLKEKILGNKTTSELIACGFLSNNLGNEIGIKIKIKRSPTFVKEFNINVVESFYDTLRFRINFYDIKNGLPNNRLFDKNIIVTSIVKKGKITVELSEYNIVVEDDFVVSIEWIEDLGPSDGLKFSCGVLGKSIIVRQTSQGNWAKLTGLSIGINVRTLY